MGEEESVAKRRKLLSTAQAASGSRGEAKLVNRQSEVLKVRDCPYLSTVRRNCLDFDVERLCSESGEDQNVYACLVCGKYFRGRGKLTPAFKHSLNSSGAAAVAGSKSTAAGHNLFISLTTGYVYCLPENYEVDDCSLDDIKFNLFPKFSEDDLKVFAAVSEGKLDSEVQDQRVLSRALNGIEYLPGLQGLNSINDKTDYINVVVHLLAQVLPLRNYLLLIGRDHHEQPHSELMIILSNLMKQMFNYRSFKGMILPHNLCQYCDKRANSDGSHLFSLTERGNAHEFMLWLMDDIRKSPEGERFTNLFRGKLSVDRDTFDVNDVKPITLKKFRCLTISISEVNSTSTVSKKVEGHDDDPHLHELLSRQFSNPESGISAGMSGIGGGSGMGTGGTSGNGGRYSLWKLPPYLLLHYQRFKRNNFFIEKNTTLIQFPLTGLDLSEFLHPDSPELLRGKSCRYSLVGNVIHLGDVDKGKYVVQILRNQQWYEVEDLRVFPIEAHRVAVSQCFLQMWRREEHRAES